MERPIFYKNWHQLGISGVNKVIKEASKIFLSPNEFENLYHTKVCPLTFWEVAAAVKTLWKNQKSNMAADIKEQETFTNATLKSNNPLGWPSNN